jgi:GT2 family glycosyltransferase
VDALDVPVTVVDNRADNVGYCVAVNRAVRASSADYVVCVNPDAVVEPGCLAHLAAIADAQPDVAVVGAQILLPDGRRNAGPNPLHPSGISPPGGHGEPREAGPPRDSMVVSGACCLYRRSAFLELGGLTERFFVYYDDVDFCWRAWIAGWRAVYCPDATVRHDYAFDRHARKWTWLERNRLAAVVANHETRTLLRLAPWLVATELGLLGVAAVQGWLPAKLRAYRELIGWPVRDQRRGVQRSRRRPDAELPFTWRLDLPGAAALNAMWRLAPR